MVVDREKILNKDGLRNKREFVNHKILDLSGIFYCPDSEFWVKLLVIKEAMNLRIGFKKLFSNKSSYSSIEIKENNLSQKLAQINKIKLL